MNDFKEHRRLFFSQLDKHPVVDDEKIDLGNILFELQELRPLHACLPMAPIRADSALIAKNTGYPEFSQGSLS